MEKVYCKCGKPLVHHRDLCVDCFKKKLKAYQRVVFVETTIILVVFLLFTVFFEDLF